MVGQETPQERQVVLAPFDDLVEIVARSDRTADHEQQNLRQRMGDPPALTLVLNQREMIQKHAKPRPIPKVHGCLLLRTSRP